MGCLISNPSSIHWLANELPPIKWGRNSIYLVGLFCRIHMVIFCRAFSAVLGTSAPCRSLSLFVVPLLSFHSLDNLAKGAGRHPSSIFLQKRIKVHEAGDVPHHPPASTTTTCEEVALSSDLIPGPIHGLLMCALGLITMSPRLPLCF